MARLDVDLAEALQRYDLLGSVELEAFHREIRPRFPEPDAACAELVRRGWLTPFQTGELLNDRGPALVLGSYVLLEPLGHGGMGQLFKARHRLMRRTVAIKLIRPECLNRPTAVARFLREIHLLARLSHPNVILAHDAERVEGRYFLVMEYCDGQDLGKLVRTGGPLSVGRACDYVRQAALGLQHAADQGLVHRDVKPDNLLVVHGVVKVLDFGLSCLREPDRPASGSLSASGDFLGTPDYAAPEQANDIQSTDIRSDLYGLGGTLYFALAGKPPFPGGGVMDKLFRHQHEAPRPIRQHRPDVPAEVQAIVARLLAKKQADRFQSPAALAEALRPFCDDGPLPLLPPRGTAEKIGDTPNDDGVLATTAAYSPNSRANLDATETRARRVGKSRFRRIDIMAGLIGTFSVVVVGIAMSFTVQTEGDSPINTRPGSNSPENPVPPASQLKYPTSPPILPPSLWTLRKRIEPPLERPSSLAYSPDGKTLAIAYGNWDEPLKPGFVRLVALDVGGPSSTLAGHKHGVQTVAYSPDGAVLASATGAMNTAIPGEIILWNREAGKPRQTLAAQPGGALALAISRTHLAAGGRGETVKVWELTSDGARNPFELPVFADLVDDKCVGSLDFSPDGRYLAAGGNEGTVLVWDVAAKKVHAALKTERNCGAIIDLKFSPDGESLVGVTCSADVAKNPLAILVWHPHRPQPENGIPVPLSDNGWNFSALAFLPNSPEILTGDQGGRVRLWDLTRNLASSTLQIEDRDWVVALRLSPQGTTAATASSDRIVRIWDVSPPGHSHSNP